MDYGGLYLEEQNNKVREEESDPLQYLFFN